MTIKQHFPAHSDPQYAQPQLFDPEGAEMDRNSYNSPKAHRRLSEEYTSNASTRNSPLQRSVDDYHNKVINRTAQRNDAERWMSK